MKVLVVKLADMGDVLTATPALRALRQSLPGAEVSALVTPGSAAVLDESPLVDHLLLFDKFRFDEPRQALTPSALAYGADLFRRLRLERFEAVAILHHLTTRWGALKYAALALASGAQRRVGLDNGRGWFLTEAAVDYGFGGRHEVEYWLEVASLLGAKVKPYPMEAPRADDGSIAQLLPAEMGEPLVALHSGGGGYGRVRRWPVAGFIEVAERLIDEYNASIVMVGGRGEEALAAQVARGVSRPVVNLAGKTSLSELAGVLGRCSLFIGGDSGVMHLAAAVGTSVVAIFGPSNPNAWGPWVGAQGKALVVQAQQPGCPCLYVGRGVGDVAGCQSMGCLTAVSPEMVLEAARCLLNGEDG